MNILVTGASKGIGKVIAQEMKRLGNVYVTARDEHALKNLKMKGYIVCDLSVENKLNHILSVNLRAPIFLINKAVPYMKQNGFGRIINIGSISGVMGEANASLYSATKAGLIGLTKATGLELAQYGITVNTINPGWVDTELGKNSINESDFSEEEILDCIPQKRYVDPKEIAGMIKYLISEDAKGITGQSINLCAGLSVGI